MRALVGGGRTCAGAGDLGGGSDFPPGGPSGAGTAFGLLNVEAAGALASSAFSTGGVALADFGFFGPRLSMNASDSRFDTNGELSWLPAVELSAGIVRAAAAASGTLIAYSSPLSDFYKRQDKTILQNCSATNPYIMIY